MPITCLTKIYNTTRNFVLKDDLFMKKIVFATLLSSMFLTTFAVNADSQPQGIQQTPVYDAQTYVVLKNIEARLAELNLKLSAPNTPGCSDGEHIYSPGISIKKNGSSYRCDRDGSNYSWKFEYQ